MKSTGEVLGLDKDPTKAMFKAFLSAGYNFSQKGTLLCTVSDRDKEEALPLIKGFYNLGYEIIATEGTANFLEANNIVTEKVNKSVARGHHM